MIKSLLIVLAILGVFEQQLCDAKDELQLSDQQMKKFASKLEKTHQIKFLTKTVGNDRRIVVLLAKKNQRRNLDIRSNDDRLRALLIASGLFYTGIYYSAHIVNPVRSPTGLVTINMFNLIGAGSVMYSSIQLTKYATEPFFSKNYAFRWFNHYTTLKGDPSFQLAKKIDEDLKKSSSQKLPSAFSLEYIDLAQFEPVLAILTSCLFGYKLNSMENSIMESGSMGLSPSLN